MHVSSMQASCVLFLGWLQWTGLHKYCGWTTFCVGHQARGTRKHSSYTCTAWPPGFPDANNNRFWANLSFCRSLASVTRGNPVTALILV